MTPEERMDKFEGDLAQMREDHDRSIAGLRRLAIQFMRMSRAEHQAFMARHEATMARIEAERETFRAEHEIFMAQHEAIMAEYEKEREKRTALEGRVDGIEEMTKFLRELLEKNLRPPEKPPETTH